MTLPHLTSLVENHQQEQGLEGRTRYEGENENQQNDVQFIAPSQQQDYVSLEEYEVNDLEIKLRSNKSDILLMEKDLEQICQSQIMREAFNVTKQKFMNFENEVKIASVTAAKTASLSHTGLDAEQAIFASRSRFLRVLLEGCERYQKVLLEMLNHPQVETFKPKRRTLTDRGKLILGKWFEEHRLNPFPTTEEKEMLAREAGAPVEQISTWFINARARKGKPAETIIKKKGNKKYKLAALE